LLDSFSDFRVRNFHCWNYRRHVVIQGKFSLLDEFAFTTKKITENFSNYSAWHLRSDLITRIWSGEELKERLEKEFEFVQNAFYTDATDQSPWFYYR
jgi:geranylgeranyl transferase type-2 subunit alpha